MTAAKKIKQYIEEYAPEFLLRPIMRRRYRIRGTDAGQTAEQSFTNIYQANAWGSAESPSGGGSEVSRAAAISAELPALIRELDVRLFLDLPCGDFNWMRHVDLGACRYIGGDIVRPLIDANQAQYGSESRHFQHLDLTRDELPRADLILVRDCLIHLSFEMAFAAIANIKRAGIRYLLTTTYPHKRRNWDIETGGFRPINLERKPFNFPPPLRLIREDVTPESPAHERHLGLWRVEDLPSLS